MAVVEKNPVANPMIVFREEYDDWAILFDPDSSETYGLNPTSAFVWKMLNGKNSKSNILDALKEACEGGIPEDAPKHLDEFLADLEKHGLSGYEK